MSVDDTRDIIWRIESLGYKVDAGTAGYRVRFAATDANGMIHVATAEDEYQAVRELAELVGLDLDAE
ncbi:MAG: hypothetical protein GC159_08470 [Phycisphaera sp.]|nr:hypothetical protein [Phycisphaera sp.]